MYELEISLLAAIIQRGGDDVLTKLNEDDFTNINNKRIFNTIKDIWLDGDTISLANVKTVNPEITISDIVNADSMVLATKDEIDNMTARIKNISAKRKLNNLLADVKQDINNGVDAELIKTKIYDALDKIDADTNKKGIKDLKQVLFETTEWIERQYIKAENNDLLYTGIPVLDHNTGGLFDSEMTVIAARPSVGKTALALFIAMNFAKAGRKVYFVSREMSSNAIGMRILSMATEIGTGQIKAGRINEKQWQSIAQGVAKYSIPNIKIDTESKSPSEIKAVAKEMQAQTGLDVVIIDYLQILEHDGKYGNREQEVASISRNLKRLSLAIQKPVVVLAQLNRNAENRRPVLADLRESGAIEADADNIWFLHYPAESQLDDAQKFKYTACKKNNCEYMEIIIGKHRNGPLGMVDVLFNPRKMSFTCFTDVAPF